MELVLKGYEMRKCLFIMLIGLLGVSILVGCDLAQTMLNLIPPDSLLNLSQLQQVDIAGQPNRLIPDYPDYDKDPTCVIPGFCGPNHWYPFSIGQQTSSGATSSTQ